MLGFIIAIGAGFLVPTITDQVGQRLSEVLRRFMPIELAEARIIALLAALLGASVLAAVFDSGTPFGIALGLTLGYFGTRILTMVKKAIDGR